MLVNSISLYVPEIEYLKYTGLLPSMKSVYPLIGKREKGMNC